ncbi:MAG TPA: cyclic pyranopterin monophosphate synthase MoaC [Bacillota bacterium]|nr:cyclic pyranopterin monophosphate synthase MoaC [Bacillota bacterium]
MGLTHVDEEGNAVMVDVSNKEKTVRTAEATGTVTIKSDTMRLIREGSAKGDVLAVARVAGIMAAKRTPELIPLCHQIPLDSVKIDFSMDDEKSRVDILATVRSTWQTGVEMEALTAVSVAALTIYDMCKAVDRAMVIGEVRLLRKTGGRSGTYDGTAS